MVELDHIILKVNELDKSVAFYAGVLGFEHAGVDGPFTVIRTGENF
jgi:catechol 2,3-dioxygenase-like lactoylglutathione lyase family enzyme|tara:strand:+ start:750 stop:887 length:138 start_codon:yes stop_codon:yes gene_type:complete